MAKKKPKKKWIPKNLKKGALTNAAKRAGMSITEYCSQGGLSATTKRRCALAKTFRKMGKKKRG